MADIYSPEKRSDIMSKVCSKNSKPERIVRSLVHKMGYRFRLHRKDLPGTPDLVFPKYKKVIFVNGCFWHSHGCKKSKLPESNSEFWKEKIGKNVERDKMNYAELKKSGWAYLILWECEIKKDYDILVKRINEFLSST